MMMEQYQTTTQFLIRQFGEQGSALLKRLIGTLEMVDECLSHPNVLVRQAAATVSRDGNSAKTESLLAALDDPEPRAIQAGPVVSVQGIEIGFIPCQKGDLPLLAQRLKGPRRDPERSPDKAKPLAPANFFTDERLNQYGCDQRLCSQYECANTDGHSAINRFKHAPEIDAMNQDTTAYDVRIIAEVRRPRAT